MAVEDFVIARNPDDDSSLPYLVRLPLGPNGVVLKVRDVWPRTAAVYCHHAIEWPADVEIVERVAVRSCVRRGAAIDLVLERGKENRSQFVFTTARGREVIFWQSARTSKQAKPAVSLPTARAAGQVIEVLVDVHERYPWTFARQQATTEAQIRFPSVPIVFCETRLLAQEWTYRFLGAALVHHGEDVVATPLADALPVAGPLT